MRYMIAVAMAVMVMKTWIGVIFFLNLQRRTDQIMRTKE